MRLIKFTLPVNRFFPPVPVQKITLLMVFTVSIPVVQQHLREQSGRCISILIATNFCPFSFACGEIVLTWVVNKTDYFQRTQSSKAVLCSSSVQQHSLFSSLALFSSSFFISKKNLACENSRFSSLLVAGNVSRGGTSAIQRQKFHTDDAKSVRNLVRSADWTTEQLHCCSYCLRMRDKRQKATKVKYKRGESKTKQSIFVVYILLQKKHLSFAGARSQMNTILYRNRTGET